jgi:DNA transformation protein
MKVSEDYKNFIAEQISIFNPILFKKMFGGYGIFKDGLMFAMISPGDIFRMRADDHNGNGYFSAIMNQFLSHGGIKGMP